MGKLRRVSRLRRGGYRLRATLQAPVPARRPGCAFAIGGERRSVQAEAAARAGCVRKAAGDLMCLTCAFAARRRRIMRTPGGFEDVIIEDLD